MDRLRRWMVLLGLVAAVVGGADPAAAVGEGSGDCPSGGCGLNHNETVLAG